MSLKMSKLYSLQKICKTYLLDRSPNEQFFMQMALQTQVEFFQTIDQESFKNLCWTMTTHLYHQGETIYEMGDPGDSIFIVVQG